MTLHIVNLQVLQNLSVFPLLQRLDVSEVFFDTIYDQSQLHVLQSRGFGLDEFPRRRSTSRISGLVVFPVGDERHEFFGRQIHDAEQFQGLVLVVRRVIQACRISSPEKDGVG